MTKKIHVVGDRNQGKAMEKLFRNPLHIGSLRNKPCVCGSGKKIKSCHGVKYSLPEGEARVIAQMLVDQSKPKLTSKE